MIKKLYWRIRIFWLALKWVPNVNLGDLVIYRGKKHTVINGTRPLSWELIDNTTVINAPRTECKKVYTFTGMLQSFKSGWHFYMSNWFDIWCRGGIRPWMKECNIWQEKNR